MSGITLTEANKLTGNAMQKGIVQTIARESAVLEVLPFETIFGATYGFIREESTGGVGFRAVNEDYVHANPTNSEHFEELRRLGSKVEVDRYIELTGNLNNVRAEATVSKAKAIANHFTQTFFHGDSSVNPMEFDGLNKRMDATQAIDASGFPIHTGLIHQLLDKVMGGANVIFMNKKTRRKVNELFMAQKAFIEPSQDAFGRPVQRFGDVRIAVVEDMYLPDNAIYAMSLGPDAVTGIQAGEITAVDNGLRGTTYETLIEWYVSIVVGNPYSVAKLTGFTI